MYINNIYQDKILKYPLTDSEYNNINNVWDFVKIFGKKFISLSYFREYVIKKTKKYTIEEFYLYESILNKMFWNLRWLSFPLWHGDAYLSQNDIPERIKVSRRDNGHSVSEEEYTNFVKNNYNNFTEIPNSLLLCKKEKYTDKNLKNKLYNNNVLMQDNYYRSFINKLIIIDKKNKLLISKPLEGSSEIFSKNYFNLLTITILLKKKLYEKIMKYPYSVKYQKFIRKLLDSHYYQLDYGFPNLNYCVYTFGNKKDRMTRIKKMYYLYPLKKIKKQARMWFELME